MSADLDARYRTLGSALAACGQGHVLAFWRELSESQRAELLADVAALNLPELPTLERIVRGEHGAAHSAGPIEPATVIDPTTAGTEARRRGEALIAGGKVAALTVAGGQGTRLGFAGPKGAFPLSPVRHKPLFQLFAESILAASRRYGTDIHWYVMTSGANDAETREFFDRHGRWGLPAHTVHFFVQGVLPAFDPRGRILLDQKHRIALAPDGHGGSLLAMARSGVLADMAARGIEHISYFQVDNPLVRCIDPLFLGLHDAHEAEVSSKALPKADDVEKVGNVVRLAGRLAVIEYSDFPEELARARNPDGTRRFDAGNIAIHVFSRRFVERLTADPAAFALPWHLAKKTVPCIDAATGQRVEPAEPNAIKLEAFVFDAIPKAERAILLATRREEEFSPVKNATGVDSVATAQTDLSRRAERWLQTAGIAIPTDPKTPNVYEISPLAATEAEELRSAGPALHMLREPEGWYME